MYIYLLAADSKSSLESFDDLIHKYIYMGIEFNIYNKNKEIKYTIKI
jgi:hypothetical protein